jgi:hypothetical protein
VTATIADASAFTLYGDVQTNEVIGGSHGAAQPGARPRRVGLNVI